MTETNTVSHHQAAPDDAVPELAMRNIGKSFANIRALSNVSLSVRGGEIHALMGENGAGKSTLMKILSGAYRADPGGEVRLRGALVEVDGPLAGRRHHVPSGVVGDVVADEAAVGKRLRQLDQRPSAPAADVGDASTVT